MNPEIFHIGNISIKWYSVLILIGIIIGFYLADKEGKKKKLPKDFIFDMGFWVVIFGILGARLYYVIFEFAKYKDNLLEIFAIWNGGLAIHGGIIGGLITLIVYCKLHKQDILKCTDIVVPSLILAQAIGRWGNFFNQEAYGFGSVSLDFLQKLHIPKFIIDGMFIVDQQCPIGCYHHPTFLYESLWCLLGFIIIVLIRYFFKNLKQGQLTAFYLMYYGLGRFFIEGLRTDSLMFFGLRQAQIISITFFVIGLVLFIGLFFYNFKKNNEEQ